MDKVVVEHHLKHGTRANHGQPVVDGAKVLPNIVRNVDALLKRLHQHLQQGRQWDKAQIRRKGSK